MHFRPLRPQEVPKTLNTSYNFDSPCNPHKGSVSAAPTREYMNRVNTLYIQYTSVWCDKKESEMVPWRRFDRPLHCPAITVHISEIQILFFHTEFGKYQVNFIFFFIFELVRHVRYAYSWLSKTKPNPLRQTDSITVAPLGSNCTPAPWVTV